MGFLDVPNKLPVRLGEAALNATYGAPKLDKAEAATTYAPVADGVSAAKPSRTLPNPLARWRFKEAAAPYVDDSGNYSLGQGPGATVTSVGTGPWGGGISLDGATDYLTIAAANTRDLNAARFGNSVSVVAWVKRNSTEGGFIGGMWQEDNTDHRRQYGLFLSLPTYGGLHQVCGHISKTGGASPGIPYSRDYSSSARTVGLSKYRMVALTYDGAQIISYLDGVADERPVYTEPGAPYGDGRSYAKNPYLFPDGLNRTTIADFTVGAVKLTSGMGNFFNGEIGGLAVYDVALTQKEIMRLHLSALTPGSPVIDLDFNNYGDTVGGDVGWLSVNGPAAVDSSNSVPEVNFKVTDISGNKYTYRTNANPANTTQPGFGYFPYIKGISAKQIQTLKFTLNNSLAVDKVRLAVRIGTKWYATDALYGMAGDGATGGNWAAAETKTIAYAPTASLWRDLTVTPGTALTLGAVRTADIPDGELTGVGFYNPSAAGFVRIANLQVICF